MQRITRQPDLCPGRPTIRGLHILVTTLIAGRADDDRLGEFPAEDRHPERDDVAADRAFAEASE